METPILDVCCGSKMFYFDKNNPNVTFMDCRELEDILCDGRKLEVKPDIIADFRNIPFDDNSFSMVVFDPPHLHRIGENSWMAKKYGKLTDTWREDISKGFSECLRVLKPNGTLIFKWNEEQIKLSEILPLFSQKPILGNRRAKTHWLVFMKEGDQMACIFGIEAPCDECRMCESVKAGKSEEEQKQQNIDN